VCTAAPARARTSSARLLDVWPVEKERALRVLSPWKDALVDQQAPRRRKACRHAPAPLLVLRFLSTLAQHERVGAKRSLFEGLEADDASNSIFARTVIGHLASVIPRKAVEKTRKPWIPLGFAGREGLGLRTSSLALTRP
jgi:hypothetical protein